MLLYNSLTDERNGIKEEGNKVKDKSHKLINKISEGGNVDSNFSSCAIMFAKFNEIVGQLVAQNYAIYQKETNYHEIEALIDDIREFNKSVNKQSIVEKLRELDKTKTQYIKKKEDYEKAVNFTEEAIK